MNDLAAMTALIHEASRKALMRGSLGVNEDFFVLGANSLTIIDLQYQIEQILGVSVATSLLMRTPTVEGWAGVFHRGLAQG